MTIASQRSYQLHQIFTNDKISRKILAQLSFKDLKNCSMVNKLFHLAVEDFRPHKRLHVGYELHKELDVSDLTLEKYLSKSRQKFQYVTDVDIRTWPNNSSLPADFYEYLFSNSNYMKIKSITLRGRGKWTQCCCPDESGKAANLNKKPDLPDLEYLHIVRPFQISSCALLDLVSRSPKLKVLKFYGLLQNPEHAEKFRANHFASDLECVYWPWPLKRHDETLSIIVKRNENIKIFYSNCLTTCELLSKDSLQNLEFLSLILNENWVCKPKRTKRVYNYLNQIKYLRAAKKLIGLEIRTFELNREEEDGDAKSVSEIRETNNIVERLFEEYKTHFWEHIGTLNHLKYLAIYGSWELEEVCRELRNKKLTIEYLRIHLLPNSIISNMDDEDPKYILSVAEGFKCIRKLVNLRSLHYTCYDKLLEIDEDTTEAVKEMIDLIWSLDIKISFTPEIADFLGTLQKRGNQLGRTYKLVILVQPKKSDTYTSFVMERNLNKDSSLLESLNREAEKECQRRYKESHDSIHLWGIELTGFSRDTDSFQKINSGWQFYHEKFNRSMVTL